MKHRNFQAKLGSSWFQMNIRESGFAQARTYLLGSLAASLVACVSGGLVGCGATGAEDSTPRDERVSVRKGPASNVGAPMRDSAVLFRLDVPDSSTIIIPLDAAQGSALVRALQSRTPPTLAVRSDGTKLQAQLIRIIRADATVSDSWLGSPGLWIAQPWNAPVNGGNTQSKNWIGSYAVQVDFAAQQNASTSANTTTESDSSDQTLQLLHIGGDIAEFVINPIPSRNRLVRPFIQDRPLIQDRPNAQDLQVTGASSSADSPWIPVLTPKELRDNATISAIATEALSPITRWRWRLLVDGLDPARDPAPNLDGTSAPGVPIVPRFADPAIEALAQQNEDRWRVALAWLWFADASVARRVKDRVAAVARFAVPSVSGDASVQGVHIGRVAPLWTTDHSELDMLLADLLEPSIDAFARVRLAQRWLDAQPPAAAWIKDDGGILIAPDESGLKLNAQAMHGVIASVGVINLLDRSTLAWTQLSPGEAATDLVAVPSFTGALLSRAFSPNTNTNTSNQAQMRILSVHLGKVEIPLLVRVAPMLVTPPGATMGPFLRDWTMRSFQGLAEDSPNVQAQVQSEVQWASAALLHKAVATTRVRSDVEDPAADPNALMALGRDSWELFVENRIPAEVIEASSKDKTIELSRESVTLFVGPLGVPDAVVRVSRVGVVEATGPKANLFPRLVPITRGHDRWSFRLPINDVVIGPEQVLRVGIVRTDAMGRRWSFPRAMLPWEVEPARVAFNLAAWSK